MRTTTVKAQVVASGIQPVFAVLYMRTSVYHANGVDSFEGREAQLTALAESLGWIVKYVIIENDAPDGKRRSASGWKRTRVVKPNGEVTWRNQRKRFPEVMAHLRAGRANGLLIEAASRLMRDPRDYWDFTDVTREHKINVRSLHGNSLTLTDGGTDDEIENGRREVDRAYEESLTASRRQKPARERRAHKGGNTGGHRYFGFEPDGVTVRESEAKYIADFDRRLLQPNPPSMKALTRELINNEVSTVTGARWRPGTLRQTLCRPRNAGWLVHREEILRDPDGNPKKAPWPALVKPEVHEAVVRKLTDPARATESSGPAPRLLGTGVYLCGRCDNGTSMKSHGGGRYRCQMEEHLARSAKHVDLLVMGTVVDLLSDPRLAVLLRPKSTSDVDVASLKEEAAVIRANLNALARDAITLGFDREQIRVANEEGHRRLAKIQEALNSAVVEETAAMGMLSMDAPGDAFLIAPLATQQAVIRELMTVTILPVGGGPGFKPEGVRIMPISA